MFNRVFFPAAIITILLLAFAFKNSDDQFTKTELYFGLSRPDGGYVTNDEFNAFTDSVVSKFFPEGFSIINVNGKWFDPDKQQTISEESRLIVRLSKMDDVNSANIDTIRARYMRYFNQQSVLRIDQKAEVWF